LQFVYSNNELINFTPEFRYLSFESTKELLSDQVGGKNHAEKFLRSAINNNELVAWHPLVGAITMEQSLSEGRWQYCFFADWQLKMIMENEVGCSFRNDLHVNKADCNPGKKELAHTKWLREIWKSEGTPTGNLFFEKLKNYKGKNDSPILDWYYSSPKGPGIKLKTETGITNHYPKQQIQKLASKFSKEYKQLNK